jgi:hypothetical protein
MPIYSYVALKQGKEVVQGEVTASNLKDARDVIRKMGLVPTKINEFNDAKQKRGGSISPLSLTEKIDFISTLQILLQSGIPAVESLMFMEQEAAKKKIREAYGALTPEQQDKLKKLEELAKDHRNRDIAIFLSETLKDKSLTQEQKRAELEYAYNLVVNNAIEEAEEAETQSRVEADNASIDAATDTQTGNYAQVTAILSDGLGGTKEVVGNVVGWIGDSPIFVADGMENTEENRRVLKQGEWNPETLIARPAEEVKAIKDKYVKVMDTYKVAFETLAEGCETQDEATINAGSQKLEEAVELLDEYNKALEELAKEHGSEVEY